MKKIRKLPQERPPKEYLSDDEVKRLFKCFNKEIFCEYRNMIAMMIMLDSGTRLGETRSLEVDQITCQPQVA